MDHGGSSLHVDNTRDKIQKGQLAKISSLKMVSKGALITAIANCVANSSLAHNIISISQSSKVTWRLWQEGSSDCGSQKN